VVLEGDDDAGFRGRLLLGGALAVIAHTAERSARAGKGRAFGSPHHLAPEQCRGEKVGPETDVWAMGVVLYEALTGRAPFDGDSPIEVVASVLSDDPPSLEGRVPRAIEEVLRQCLAKRLADRPPDAEAMCLMLAAAARSAQESTPPPRPVTIKPTPTRMQAPGVARGQAAIFSAADLDALAVMHAQAASPDTSFAPTTDDATTINAPAHEAPPPAPSGDFDLDFGDPTPPPDAPLNVVLPAPVVVVPSAPSEQTPSATTPSLPASNDFFASLEVATTNAASPQNTAAATGRDSQVHTSLSAEVVDRTKAPVVRRPRAVNPYVAFLGVVGITSGIAYAGWCRTFTYPRVRDAARRRPDALEHAHRRYADR
jgi:serine/threonine-protein kinase